MLYNSKAQHLLTPRNDHSRWFFQPQQPLGPPCTHTKPFFTIPKANFQPLEPPVQPTEPNQPTCRTTKSAREKDNLRPNRQATFPA